MIRFGVIGIILSVALILAAVAVMLISPEVVEPLVCNESETFETRSRRTVDARGSATAIDFYCVDRDSQEARDVTGTLVVPFVVASICLPFVFVIPIILGVRRRAAGFFQALPGMEGASLSNWNALQERLSHMPGAQVVDQSASDDDDLVDKLRQLQQALTMGLITQKEHDRAKKELLDNLSG